MDLSIFLIILVVPIMACAVVIKNYNKCKNILNQNNISGVEVAHKLLEDNKLDNVYVVEIPQILNDHYDYNRKVVRLSKEVFNENTISSLVVSAQQCAYAIQDKNNNFLIKLKNILVPLIKVVIIFSYVLIIIGAMASMMDALNLGVSLIIICLVYELIMLPVEFNANKIALKELKKLKLIEKSEEDVVSRLLRTLSFKYVASIITSIVDLIKYLTSLISDKN